MHICHELHSDQTPKAVDIVPVVDDVVCVEVVGVEIAVVVGDDGQLQDPESVNLQTTENKLSQPVSAHIPSVLNLTQGSTGFAICIIDRLK